MANIRTHLTKRLVLGHRLKDGVDFIRDDECKGFFCRASTTSRGLYVQADRGYRRPDGTIRRGAQKTVKIADVDENVDVAAARRQAVSLKAKITSGELDAPKPIQRKSLTLRDAMDAYLRTRDLKSEKEFRRSVCFQFGGTRGRDGAHMRKALEDFDRQFIERHYRPTASVDMAFRNFAAILRWAAHHRPEAHVDPEVFPTLKAMMAQYQPKPAPLTIKRHHVPALWQAMHEEADPIPDWLAFQLLVGMRRSEAGKLRIEDLDFADRSFVAPDSKNSDPIYLPMSDRVLSLLQRRAQGRTEGFVFDAPQLKNGWIEAECCSVQMRRWKKRVRELTGDSKVNATPHQLRKFCLHHLSATLQVPDSIVEWAAAHRATSVRGRHYADRSDVEPLRVPLQRWEDFLFELIEGTEKVRPMAARAG